MDKITLEEIKKAINKGLTVNWKNVLYEVKYHTYADKYYILHMSVFKSRDAEAFILNESNINECYIRENK